MLLQEGVPLKAACGWKRVACVSPPMAISRSLPVVLDLVSLSLSRGGRRSLSTWWCQLQEQEHPCIFFFPLSFLWRFAEAKSALRLISWPLFLCFLRPCRNATVLHGRAHPFSQLSVYPMPGCSNQLLAHCPSLPLHGQPDHGRYHPSSLWGSCRQLFPARAGSCQNTGCTLEGSQGLFGDLAKFMPASAPPCARNSQVFNYNPLGKAAEDTGDFGGSWLGTSAASSLCSP